VITLTLEFKSQVIEKFSFEKETVTIGRIPENDIRIDNLLVSRRHAKIFREGENYILEDLNSANGTFVNNERISRYFLKDGDIITIGKHQLIFSAPQKGQKKSDWDLGKIEGTVVAKVQSEEKTPIPGSPRREEISPAPSPFSSQVKEEKDLFWLFLVVILSLVIAIAIFLLAK
jgi:pSer/pThr/pTyr-binding forkhead associated (FHA) protein